MTNQNHKYQIEYVVTELGGMKQKKTRVVHYTKSIDGWKRKDYETLEKYLKQIKQQYGRSQ